LLSAKQLIGPVNSEGLEKDYQGWNSLHPIFEKLVNEVRPKVYVECGVWKGMSLLNVAKLTRDMGTTLYACDTWLGGIDHILSDQPVDRIKKDKWGYPMLYHQFLFNLAGTGCEERVFPVVNTSVNGARLLRAKGVQADLVYIDGSHEYPDAYLDMEEYWKLVRPGGVMFGDDYGFPGVVSSLSEWTGTVRVNPEIIDNNFWVIRK
jgi:hypothetical protein